MRLVEFKNPLIMAIDKKPIKIKSKSMYLFSDVIWNAFKNKLTGVITDKANVSIFNRKEIDRLSGKVIKTDEDISNILTKFNVNNFDLSQNPVILRTGGIGDLIALSSIATFLSDELNVPDQNISFVSQEKYRAVFSWFKNPIKFISYFMPVASWKSNSAINRQKVFNKYKPIYFEGVIENSNQNWFDIQYDQVGVPKINPEYGRPQLSTTRINNNPSNIDKSKPSILVNPRSTAIIRSMRFADIYQSIVNIIGDLDVNIYVHIRNLCEEDKYFIIDQVKLDNRIKIIEAKSLEIFFLDAFDVDLSISVDTALLHFREGVQKPAIGIYTAFPSDCRTRYYKYTKSIDITSECSLMPCYKHVKQANEICDVQQSLHETEQYNKKYYWTAPCSCSAWNNSVINQLEEKMKEYVLKIINR